MDTKDRTGTTLAVERHIDGALRRVQVERHGRAGGGPVCIALHSGPGFGAATLRAGADQLAAAAGLGELALIDLPGGGQSSRHPGSGYPIEAYIADVLEVAQAIGPLRPVLLGHGWGAILAVETALAHPKAVGGVVLVNPLHILGGAGQDGEAQLRQVQRTDATLVERFNADVMPALQQAMQGQAPWEAVDGHPWWNEMLLTQWAGAPSAAWHAALHGHRFGMEAYFAHKGQAMFDPESAWARYDLAARMPLLNCPASVLASGHDANYVALPSIHVDPMRAACPGLVVELTDAGGHFLVSEAPAVVAAHLRRHLARTA